MYNKKHFLAPSSIDSMSAIHCKVKDNRAIIRISDCNNSIRLHNDITNALELQEMIEKITVLKKELTKFKDYLILVQRTEEIKPCKHTTDGYCIRAENNYCNPNECKGCDHHLKSIIVLDATHLDEITALKCDTCGKIVES